MSKLPEPQQPDAALPAAQDAQAAVASSPSKDANTREADRTIIGTVLEVEREFIWIETEGTGAKLYASELMLDIGEVPADRYAPGDRFEAFVFQMGPDPESGAPQFSIRCAAPYLDALNRFEVGNIVANATVVNTYDLGVELDVDGVRGNAFAWELPLARGESTHQRYQPGELTNDLLVYEIDNDRGFFLSARRNAPGYVEALNGHSVGDVVSATVTGFQSNDGLWLDVGGVVGGVSPDELILAEGESPRDRYAVGEIVHGLFVGHVSRDARDLDLSVRRNAPGYVEALNARSVGDIVSGVITEIDDDDDLTLDINGVIGYVASDELVLNDGEVVGDRYAVGDVVEDLLVGHVDHDARYLGLYARRNAPGYVEALSARNIGDVVAGVVTEIDDDGELTLDIDGVIGYVAPDELVLDDGNLPKDRYAVGDTVHDLLVLWVDHDDRELGLSVRRNAPGYVEALNAHSVGDVVSAAVTAFGGRGLWLDVDGAVGWVGPQELSLADGETAQDRYAVGDTVDDLFVWQINNIRSLNLSVRRNAPGYVEALSAHSVGDVVSATVTLLSGNLWLDVDGVIGFLPRQEIALADGESIQDRYAVGNVVRARVWQIDLEGRDVTLSVRRLGSGFPEEPIKLGATIDAIVRGSTPRGIRSPVRVLAANTEVWIPPHALSLSTTMPSRFHDGQVVPVVVTKLDDEGQPAELSHRRALDRWELEMQRLSRGVVVPGARLLASGAISETEGRAAVDLGPITGFIPEDELDSETAQNLMTYSGNETYPVVVKSVDGDRGTGIVSHDEFPARWRELASEFQEDIHVDAELRDIDGRDALFDLGSGLLATLPVDQLPRSDRRDETRESRIGETFTIQIVSIEPDTHTITANIKNYHLVEMILADETLTCELKAVFLASTPNETNSQRQKRQDTNRAVVRAMAGMMNRDGGHVLVGVEDTDKKKGEVIGWDKSGFKNQNAMTTALANLVSDKLSAAAGGLFDPRFETLPDGNEILDIACEPAEEPIFLSDNKGEEFPLRYPAMTKALAAREQHQYIRERF